MTAMQTCHTPAPTAGSLPDLPPRACSAILLCSRAPALPGITRAHPAVTGGRGAGLEPRRNDVTENGTKPAMAQRFIPEIKQGDKRILLINGEPVPYALARIPAKGENRGNLAVGGEGVGIELSERDHWICKQVAPLLKAKGLIFVGIDVIGDYLTEVNVTSPTCIRELDKQYNLNISALLMDWVMNEIKQK